MGKINTKIIFVWSTPRSISTAFERCFTDRPDFDTVHEPFAECYYYGPERKSARYGDQPSQGKFTISEASSRFVIEGETNKLVKDLSFQAEPYVTEKILELWNNAFLIRHPYSVARSLVKLKPDFTRAELGFSELKKVEKRLGYIPPVVDGDKFTRAPKTSLKRFCSAFGIPFLDGFTSWSRGAVKDWTQEEYQAHTKWHGKLHESKQIEVSASVPARDDLREFGLSQEQVKWIDEAYEEPAR